MRKILVFQHVAHEPLGTLDPLLRASKYRIRYVNFERDPRAKPKIEGYNGLIVLGGPMSVYDVEEYPNLNTEVSLIQEAMDRQIPVLGICLGAQLIAKALGAKVSVNPVREIGWYDVETTDEGKKDPLLKCFKSSKKIFQWHGDTFDLPKGSVHLAHAPECRNQAFRYRDSVYAFQFHLEVDQPMIERWLRNPRNMAYMEEAGFEAEKIRNETPSYIDELKVLSDECFNSFVEIMGRPVRGIQFGSGHR